jgi:hypothetical protein
MLKIDPWQPLIDELGAEGQDEGEEVDKEVPVVDFINNFWP